MGVRNVTVVLVGVAMAWTAGAAEDLVTLWQIGEPDNETRDLALAPRAYEAVPQSVVYLVGQSEAAKDWPYAHPGPADTWAGSAPHTFLILFGLDEVPAGGNAELLIDMVDTHSSGPPRVRVCVNKFESIHSLPRGASDESISGNPAAGKEHRLAVTVPVSALKQGDNEVRIMTLSGSWLLYDAVLFRASPDAALGAVGDYLALRDVAQAPVLVKEGDALRTVVKATVFRSGAPTRVQVQVQDNPPVDVALEAGENTVRLSVEPVEEAEDQVLRVLVDGEPLAEEEFRLEPVRKWTVFLVHHTHLDIGYTHLQTEVEAKQCEFLDQAIDLARDTQDNPAGARFKWCPEGLWAVDTYLREATPEKRERFVEAVRKGWIGLDALYGNELTALCRPEELLELTGYARRVSAEYGLNIDSAMISDVPGYTWGIVPALAHSGVRYLSIGPNAGHRIGYTLRDWGDKPFYWVSPSGEEEILCWMAGKAYSWFHHRHRASMVQEKRAEELFFGYLRELEDGGYPYDMVHVRYNIGGDNGPPDPLLPEFVMDWNSRYAWPKMAIVTNSEMFRAFEDKYAEAIPRVEGDFTPYWEDGAASSARETALTRAAAERLVQAQTLWAMAAPGPYPAADFHSAWRDVLLYDEHTWGAHNSISEPESEFALGQWRIKQAFALEAERKSKDLLNRAVANRACGTRGVGTVEVLNTCSWERDGLVTLPADWELVGEAVYNAKGKRVLSQRLSTGELAFLAEGIPATGSALFAVREGKAGGRGKAKTKGNRLRNGLVEVKVDKKTGAIEKLEAKGGRNLARNAGVGGLNAYLYVAGRDPKDPQGVQDATITVKEDGPLVASLEVRSAAPGCRGLVREIRVVHGSSRVEVINVVDKEKIYEQEGVHFAFPFAVPKGVIRMDVPFAVVRPEKDQMPGACKNYFTVQRWMDVSNDDFGVTWACVDAPMVEIGAITSDPRAVGWLRETKPELTIYSYIMNNYWETNYKAAQEGPTTFRYALRPHDGFDAGEAARFGIEQSQPLIPVSVQADAAPLPPLVHVDAPNVIATAVKPCDDGEGLAVHLFGTSEMPGAVPASGLGGTVYASDLFENKGAVMSGAVTVTGYGLKALRIDTATK